MILRRATSAKLNLTLQILGRRGDGYHLLHSLVAFADFGDDLGAETADAIHLTVEGDYAGDCADLSANTVMRAARLLAPHASGRGAALSLVKHLPVAAGIGGGSGDAAAALLLLNDLWQLHLTSARLSEIALALGADVPMCLHNEACFASGIGEVLSPLSVMPELHAVLINPQMPCATGEIFAALRQREQPFSLIPETPSAFTTFAELDRYLERYGNDLESVAISLHPVIQQVLAVLRNHGRHALMSGSGATCFSLFESRNAAETAACTIRSLFPYWWIRATTLR